jgi:ubiquinone/menaquinone biosynthesis C-methylase UbiE
MKYDLTDIPAGYDRGRDHGPELRDLWMTAIEAHADGRAIRRALDLGCGTGRFTEAVAVHFDADVIGLDPSAKMLDVARAKRRDDRVRYARACAEALPLPPASVDLILMSMVFHHFDDPPAAVRECRRVLRRDGLAFVRTGTLEQIGSYAYVPFIPSTLPILERVLPRARDICVAFEAAGFETVACELITQTVAPSLSVYADKLATGSDSVLAQLPREELEAGLAALRAHAARADAQPVTEPIDVLVFKRQE